MANCRGKFTDRDTAFLLGLLLRVASRSHWPRGLTGGSAAGSPAFIVGSNPIGGHRSLSAASVVCSQGRCLCDELITHLEEYYRLLCVVVCDLETS
jgi:hypothetical protein